MRNLAFALSIVVLVLLGGWVRLQGTDGSSPPIYSMTQWNHTALRIHDAAPTLPAGFSSLLREETLQGLLDIAEGLLLLGTVVLLLENRLIAVLVCAIYMLYPAFTEDMPPLLFSDSLYGFINMLFLFAFILFFKGGRHPYLVAVACGAAFGISVQVRPTVIPFLIFFVGVAGLQCYLTRRRVLPFLLVLFSNLIVMSPWLIRNWMALERTVFTTLEAVIKE
jgi:hypothetical protein